jgi:hypothetical protein
MIENLKVGDKVQIKNQNTRGEVVIEGIATIRKIEDRDAERILARVEFDNEPGATYPRFIWDEA